LIEWQNAPTQGRNHYVYAELTDPRYSGFIDHFAAASIAAFGGWYAVRGGGPKMLKSTEPRTTVDVATIRRPEHTMEWYRSSRCQEAEDQGYVLRRKG
jgi:hypothetical protein